MSTNASLALRYSIHTRLREFHLRQLLPDFSTGTGLLLDVGCGLGYLTEALGNGFIRVGMDNDIHALRNSHIRGLKNMLQADAIKLPFKEQSFDAIICSEILEHLPNGMDKSALSEMTRILKPGGRLLITVPSLEGIRAKSTLRNLGHQDPSGGEYHYRMGYSWQDIESMVGDIPELRIRKRRYSMFFFSEIFMDFLKWNYFRKNSLREHSDMIGMKETFLFRFYRFFFPLLHFGFLCEDIFLASIFRGHILILALERIVNSKELKC